MNKKVYQFNFGHYQKISDKKLKSFLNTILLTMQVSENISGLELTENSYVKGYFPKWFGLSKDGKTIYDGHFCYKKYESTGRKNYYASVEQIMKDTSWDKVERKELNLNLKSRGYKPKRFEEKRLHKGELIKLGLRNGHPEHDTVVYDSKKDDYVRTGSGGIWVCSFKWGKKCAEKWNKEQRGIK